MKPTLQPTTPRGTRRAQRRAVAVEAAKKHNIPQKLFAKFWRYGFDAKAAELVRKYYPLETITEEACTPSKQSSV